MDELARLMEELSLALKARAEAGLRVESLAREVQQLPKLSVIAPAARAGKDETVGEFDHTRQLQLQLELQSLRHTKQEALEFLKSTVDTVAQIRQSICVAAAQLDYRCEDILDEYDSKIQREKNAFAELQQQKQDLLFKLMQQTNKLEELSKKNQHVVKN